MAGVITEIAKGQAYSRIVPRGLIGMIQDATANQERQLALNKQGIRTGFGSTFYYALLGAGESLRIRRIAAEGEFATEKVRQDDLLLAAYNVSETNRTNHRNYTRRRWWGMPQE